MHLRIGKIVLILPVCFVCMAPGTSGNKDSQNQLSIFIHGIHDGVSPGWFSNANEVAQTGDRYIIVQDKASVKAARLATDDQYTVNNDKTTSNKSNYYASLVPADHIIYFNPKDPESVDRVKALGQEKNAQVFIDMTLGVTDLSFAGRVWDQQTDWAADAAILLARSHNRQYDSKSDIMMYGHSAGTEAVGKAQMLSRYAVDENDQVSFKSIVASPRTKSEGMFPDKKNTTMILADGDYTYSPGGEIGLKCAASFVSENDAVDFAKSGYKVVRVITEKGIVPQNVYSALGRHTAANTMPAENQKVMVYAPETAKSFGFSSTQLGKVVDEVSNNDHLDDPGTVKKISQDVKKEQPSDGLGGISLNAVANIPLDPSEVSEARYDRAANTLYLVMKDGGNIPFPQMNPEALRLAFATAYEKNEKPELSIGSSPYREEGEVVKTIPHPPGRFSVYYLGGTENTYLGLAMFLADEALGALAFGSTAEVNGISSAVPGFHSLPELFPAKYTENPASQRYMEADTRVFLNTGEVTLQLNAKTGRLEFGTVGFTISMSNPGPAERYYAGFFTAHFMEIAGTRQGAALKQLIPFAKAAAVFRWLRTNAIPVQRGAIMSIPVTPVFTPRYTRPSSSPTLADVNPAYPTILFGPHGPAAFYYSSDKKTTVRYAAGKPVKIECWNGHSLEITRDARGIPVAYKTDNDTAGVFYLHPALGPVFYKNVSLSREGDRLGASVTSKTILYPENQPEETFGKLISGFILSNEPK